MSEERDNMRQALDKAIWNSVQRRLLSGESTTKEYIASTLNPQDVDFSGLPSKTILQQGSNALKFANRAFGDMWLATTLALAGLPYGRSKAGSAFAEGMLKAAAVEAWKTGVEVEDETFLVSFVNEKIKVPFQDVILICATRFCTLCKVASTVEGDPDTFVISVAGSEFDNRAVDWWKVDTSLLIGYWDNKRKVELETMYKYALQQEGAKQKNIVVVGHSMGATFAEWFGVKEHLRYICFNGMHYIMNFKKEVQRHFNYLQKQKGTSDELKQLLEHVRITQQHADHRQIKAPELGIYVSQFGDAVSFVVNPALLDGTLKHGPKFVGPETWRERGKRAYDFMSQVLGPRGGWQGVHEDDKDDDEDPNDVSTFEKKIKFLQRYMTSFTDPNCYIPEEATQLRVFAPLSIEENEIAYLAQHGMKDKFWAYLETHFANPAKRVCIKLRDLARDAPQNIRHLFSKDEMEKLISAERAIVSAIKEKKLDTLISLLPIIYTAGTHFYHALMNVDAYTGGSSLTTEGWARAACTNLAPYVGQGSASTRFNSVLHYLQQLVAGASVSALFGGRGALSTVAQLAVGGASLPTLAIGGALAAAHNGLNWFAKQGAFLLNMHLLTTLEESIYKGLIAVKVGKYYRLAENVTMVFASTSNVLDDIDSNFEQVSHYLTNRLLKTYKEGSETTYSELLPKELVEEAVVGRKRDREGMTPSTSTNSLSDSGSLSRTSSMTASGYFATKVDPKMPISLLLREADVMRRVFGLGNE